MYGFYYPENNERFLASMEFATVDETILWFRDKRPMWDAVSAHGDDQAAFLNPMTGDIIVVREIPSGES